MNTSDQRPPAKQGAKISLLYSELLELLLSHLQKQPSLSRRELTYHIYWSALLVSKADAINGIAENVDPIVRSPFHFWGMRPANLNFGPSTALAELLKVAIASGFNVDLITQLEIFCEQWGMKMDYVFAVIQPKKAPVRHEGR